MAASKAEDFRPRGQSFPIPTTLWPKLVSLRQGWGNLRYRISAVQAKPAEKWISTMDVSRPKKKQACGGELTDAHCSKAGFSTNVSCFNSPHALQA